MITLNDNTTLRKKLLEVCIEKQQSLIDDFKIRIRSLLDNDGLGNEDEYDNTDVAQATQRATEVSSLNDQLEFANDEMRELTRLTTVRDRRSVVVEPGAIVITDVSNFFISVSIEGFQVDGQDFMGVSARSPLYLAMKGMQKGEKFASNGYIYSILDII